MNPTPNIGLSEISMSDRVDKMIEYANGNANIVDKFYPVGIVIVLDESSTFDPNVLGHGTWTLHTVQVTSDLTYKYWTRTA